MVAVTVTFVFLQTRQNVFGEDNGWRGGRETHQQETQNPPHVPGARHPAASPRHRHRCATGRATSVSKTGRTVQAECRAEGLDAVSRALRIVLLPSVPLWSYGRAERSRRAAKEGAQCCSVNSSPTSFYPPSSFRVPAFIYRPNIARGDSPLPASPCFASLYLTLSSFTHTRFQLPERERERE